ncbi:MAG: Rrf2 family transcriptional regulator [Leptospiraceae bacterium]|nr:Rrf2 family transcriptional regulator [Leptospiraceae bacterium]
MQLNKYTDYSFRVMILLGADQEKLFTVNELSGLYDISKNHLVKVVHRLGKLGYIKTIPGKNGGIRLGMKPKDIKVLDVMKAMESNFFIAECFQSADLCRIAPVCNLKNVLYEALKGFEKVIAKYTLQDLIKNKEKDLLSIVSKPVSKKKSSKRNLLT